MVPQIDMAKLSEPNNPTSRANFSPGAPALYDEIGRGVTNGLRPEIPVNIYDLGSIYRIDVINRCDIGIDITLTVAGLSGRR